VIAARGGPVWYQLYHQADWNQTRQIIKRAEAADAGDRFHRGFAGWQQPRNDARAQQLDSRDCSACHKDGKPAPGLIGLVASGDNRRKPMVAEFAPGTPIPEVGTPTWEFVKRLKDSTSMKVFLKGIVTREDAELAMEHGVNGLFVSNHGGRAENSQRATIECLPEVAAGVRRPRADRARRRRSPRDGHLQGAGVRRDRGRVGRPYIWGLGAFGQEGVETVLGLLRRELDSSCARRGRRPSSASRPITLSRGKTRTRVASPSARASLRPCASRQPCDFAAVLRLAATLSFLAVLRLATVWRFAAWFGFNTFPRFHFSFCRSSLTAGLGGVASHVGRPACSSMPARLADSRWSMYARFCSS
jgi:hypothetical protein